MILLSTIRLGNTIIRHIRYSNVGATAVSKIVQNHDNCVLVNITSISFQDWRIMFHFPNYHDV